MKKHIYVNSSILDYCQFICDDDKFEPVCNYYPDERLKCSSYEWGRIKTASLCIHFIMGNPPQKGCPWCKGKAKLIQLKKENYSDPFHKLQFCMQCIKCGSRGPVIFIHQDSLIEKDMEEWLKDRIESGYSYRTPWDDCEEFNAKDGE